MPGTAAGDAARARLDRVVGNIPAWSLRGPVSMRRPSARSRTEDGSPLPALEIDAIAADVEDPIQRLEEERVRANLAAAIDRLAAENRRPPTSSGAASGSAAGEDSRGDRRGSQVDARADPPDRGDRDQVAPRGSRR